MSRKKINGEVMPARLPPGTKKKMDRVRKPGESRAEFVRVAVNCLLKRRGKRRKKPGDNNHVEIVE